MLIGSGLCDERQTDTQTHRRRLKPHSHYMGLDLLASSSCTLCHQ